MIVSMEDLAKLIDIESEVNVLVTKFTVEIRNDEYITVFRDINSNGYIMVDDEVE